MLRSAFALLTAPNTNKNILVNLEANLIGHITRHNHLLNAQILANNQNISINLMELLKAIAIITAYNGRPSWLEKYTGQRGLLDYIKQCDNFCITYHSDEDMRKEMLEKFGVGLSILVTKHYFQVTSYGKIPRKKGESKPDIKCDTSSGDIIALEAKGASTLKSRKYQKTWARKQKNKFPGANVKIASCALLMETGISDVDFCDPESEKPEDPEYEKNLIKADYYSRLFNVMGQKELSKYFTLLKRRVEEHGSIQFPEFDDKEKMYNRIKTKYLYKTFNGVTYRGNLEQIADGFYVFLGIDESLLNYYSFIKFNKTNEDHKKIEEDVFHLFSDGSCFGFLKTPKLFEDQINPVDIPNHYDFFSITDLDFSEHYVLVDFVRYLLRKCDIYPINEQYTERNWSQRFDLFFSVKGKNFAVEVKKFGNAKKIVPVLNKWFDSIANTEINMLLVTNRTLTPEILKKLFVPRNVKLIDRSAFKAILAKETSLLDYILAE